MLVFVLLPFMFMLFVLPPPALVLVVGDMTGVGVLVGVVTGELVVLVLLLVVVVLVLSLPQPNPKAATASKVRRAKVLRIELSPVTQRGQMVRELTPKLLLGFRRNASASARSIVRTTERQLS